MQEAYSAATAWDEKAGVWYVSETDFPGLVAEAETPHALMREIRLLIPGLYDANRQLMRTRSPGREIVIQLTTQRRETITLVVAS